MYYDQPGVYLSMHGTPVAEALARECGYDTEKMAREKLKRERIEQTSAMIEAEFTSVSGKEEVVQERGGIKIIDVGLGRYRLKDDQGATLSDHFFTRPEAERIFALLAPEEPAPRVPFKDKPPAEPAQG
jgi:hypothetical protein